MSRNEEDIPKSSDNMLTSKQSIPPHEESGWKDGWVPPPPAVGRHILTFPDDTQVGLNGLDDIMAELYNEDMKATDKTAEEIIKRLEGKKNYIPESERVRREYAYALLREYRSYVKDRSGSGR